jgi:hypothetical protein
MGTLDPLARLLFIGLWTEADREGRLEDRPKRIKVEILPFDECDVDFLLGALDEARFIWRYEADGRKLIQILNFTKHQKPHPKEVSFHLPAPSEQKRVISRKSREITPTSPVDLGEWIVDCGDGEEERAREVPKAKRPARSSTASAPGFTEDFFSELQADPAYQHIEVRHVYAKMVAWCKRTRKQATVERLLNWLNREEAPAKPAPKRKPPIGTSGTPMKKVPEKPVDVAAMQRLADELEKMELKEQAAAVRAGIEASK